MQTTKHSHSPLFGKYFPAKPPSGSTNSLVDVPDSLSSSFASIPPYLSTQHSNATKSTLSLTSPDSFSIRDRAESSRRPLPTPISTSLHRHPSSTSSSVSDSTGSTIDSGMRQSQSSSYYRRPARPSRFRSPWNRRNHRRSSTSSSSFPFANLSSGQLASQAASRENSNKTSTSLSTAHSRRSSINRESSSLTSPSQSDLSRSRSSLASSSSSTDPSSVSSSQSSVDQGVPAHMTAGQILFNPHHNNSTPSLVGSQAGSATSAGTERSFCATDSTVSSTSSSSSRSQSPASPSRKRRRWLSK